MFDIDGMTELNDKDARQVTGGALIIVVCGPDRSQFAENAKVQMQDFHFTM